MIGRSHPAQLASRRSRRRKIGRHADDRGFDAVLLGHVPEGPPLTQERHAAGFERKLPRTERDAPATALGSRRRQKRLHRLRVSMNEVENAVPSGIEACGERGPRDRTLGRDRRSKRPERAGLSQLQEVRHASARHQIADEVVIHPIDAEHDDAPPCLARTAVRSATHRRSGRRRPRSTSTCGGSCDSHLQTGGRPSTGAAECQRS